MFEVAEGHVAHAGVFVVADVVLYAGAAAMVALNRGDLAGLVSEDRLEAVPVMVDTILRGATVQDLNVDTGMLNHYTNGPWPRRFARGRPLRDDLSAADGLGVEQAGVALRTSEAMLKPKPASKGRCTLTQTQLEDALYIGGQWSTASGPAVAARNPATESILAEVPSATAADVERALDAAKSARRSWAQLPATERAGHLRVVAGIVEDNAEDLAQALVAEGGKPVAIARGEVAFAIAYIRYISEWDRRIEGEILPGDTAEERIHLQRVPLGVVAALCAWNFPIALYFRKVAPALLTGNTVVVKPSEVTPLSSIMLTRLIDRHGSLPPGVLNLVTGDSLTGDALVRSPKADMITMTGHRDTGKIIVANAAPNLTRVSVELGGKAPAIVLADADLETAVEAVCTARHYFAGQVCTCAERVYVHASVFDEFTDRYLSKVRTLRVGQPGTTDIDLGPLVSEAQRTKAETAVSRAVRDGARVVEGGDRPAGPEFASGYWFSPTVLLDVHGGMDVVREETFAPITPIIAVSSLEDAVAQANDTRYGLSAYLYTADYRTVMRTTAALEFGEIYVNRTLGEAMQGFHIGHKESGLGGEDGKHGVLKYTQLQTVYHNYA